MKSPSPIQWTFTRNDGTTEVVKPVAWVWEARYSDNTILKQYDDDGVYHQFKEIDQDKLVLFRMRKFDDTKHYDLLFQPGMKLIHFYRNYLLENSKYFTRTFCFGFEKTVNGKKVKMLFTILPNDDIIIADRDFSLEVK